MIWSPLVDEIDSGRIFLVVHYQNKFHFGKLSNTELTKIRTKNLKIRTEFKETIPINVFTSTFNTSNCSLSDFNNSLSDWLPNNGSIDLYALAFQELNDKQYGKEEKTNEKYNQQIEIEYSLLRHIGSNYVTVAHYKMWQTRLFLFTKKKFEYKISNVTSHFHITGIGGILRNRGAVAISLDFDGISLCFLSCHLADQQTKVKERNTMYRKICEHTKVGWRKQPLLGQFHFLFFMGCMNYCVDYFDEQQTNKPSYDTFREVCTIMKHIQRGKEEISDGGQLKIQKTYDLLLTYDQLNEQCETRRAFVDFHEHHIKFPPSFKCKKQIGIHYTSERLPAWCDRILWKCSKSFDVNGYKPKNYRIYDKVTVSDHKPVSCSFILPTWDRPCGISDDCTKAIIHFRNVSAQNLNKGGNLNGKSDPFIHFPRQLILEKYIQSKRVNNTLNPKWKNKHLKPLILMRNSLPFLQKALLLFQIRNHNKISANDIAGYGYIQLENCVNNLNKWVKFKEYLTLNGVDAGIFIGEIKLEYKIKSRKS